MSNGQNVGDVYAATLERIRAQGEDRARLGVDAIMWVAYSERPLEPEELCQALGVEIGSNDLDNDNAPSIRTILNCGLGLVTVDSSSSKVRLVHFTLQEHILANPTLFSNPHLIIAEVCLTYLNFGYINELSPSLPSLPPTTPFLEYASRYWGEHCRRETSPSVNQLALELLSRFDSHIFRNLFLDQELDSLGAFSNHESPSRKFTALHVGAFLGVLEIVVSLLKINKLDLNAADDFGMTALWWATFLGYDAIVKVLLEQEGVGPRSTNLLGNALLLCAAWAGHGTVVQMLLERNDINPDTADEGGRTPLSWAAGPTFAGPCTEEGCEGATTIPLERNDIHPHGADKSGRTTLSGVTRSGREKIIQMMQSSPNPLSPGWDFEGSMIWETQDRHEETVRILLGRSDVNSDRADKCGRTPLSWAAGLGRGETVRMLLERHDVNPDSPDKRGRTPLSWAAEYGREESVRMLLERDDVNPHSVDKSGRTPLSSAAKNGHEKIVAMLAQRNDTPPDLVEEGDQIPFPRPVGNGGASVAHWQAESHEPLISGPEEELSGPFVSDPSPLPEPPPQRTWWFWTTSGYKLSPLPYIRKALSR